MRNSKAFILIISCFILGILVTGFYFVVTENRTANVEVINDRDYAPAVLRELKSADKSIHISIFSLTYYLKYPDSSVNDFLKVLGDKHDAGVDVRIVIDEFPKDHEAGLIYLTEHGVPVRYDGDNQTTHTKLIIVDGERVVVGSTNWRYYSVDKNHEANVLIRSPQIAQEFESYFEEIWKYGY